MKIRVSFCIIFFILLTTCAYSKDFNDRYNANIVRSFRNYVCLEHRNRAVIYNALNLSDSQINQREIISERFSKFYNEKFKVLEKEAKKLDVYEKMNYSFWRIYSQRRHLESLRAEIFELLKEENRLFSCCLSREQYKKLKEIRALETKGLKNLSNKKDYYKSNPQMKAFGDKKTFKQVVGSAE
jgi:hypothetical protein